MDRVSINIYNKWSFTLLLLIVFSFRGQPENIVNNRLRYLGCPLDNLAFILISNSGEQCIQSSSHDAVVSTVHSTLAVLMS